MRLPNIFLALLLAFLGPCTAYPAWLWNDTASYVSAPDSPALDLPNSEWFITFRAQEVSRLTSARLLYRQNVPTTANSIEITMGTGGSAGEFYVNIIDASNSTLSFPITANPLNSGDPVQFILSRGADGFVRLYFDGVLAGTSNAALTTAINTSVALFIGNRSDAARGFNGPIWDIGIFHRDLTLEDIESLQEAGAAVSCLNPAGRTLYISGIGNYIELVAGLSLTNSGTTATAHPRIVLCGE